MISQEILEIKKQFLENLHCNQKIFEVSVNKNIKQCEEMLDKVVDPILKKIKEFEIEKQKIKDVQLDDTDIVKMNVGGTTYITQRSVLTQVKDSVMEAMFSGRHPIKEVDGVMFIDRDSESFKYVLSYLRNNQKMINIESNTTKQLVDIELEWWGIQPMGYTKKLKKLQKIFDSEPVTSGVNLTKWKELGPLNLQELIQKGDMIFDHSLSIESNGEYNGQVDGEKKRIGIGRHCWYNCMIYEGEWKNGRIHGFGRSVWSNGKYYIGQWKDDYQHGQGKLVYQDGTIQEGKWNGGQFVGS